MPKKTLTEVLKVAEATPIAGQPGRFRIRLLTPGWGSSGYYAPEVAEAAAAAKVFPAGLHMYINHPTPTEDRERPARSVLDLAAVLDEDAVWDGEGLDAEAIVFGPYRQVLTEMKDAIGVSIRAIAETEMGEVEGRRGLIVTEMLQGLSADFVTHAGRGGKILEVLESARDQVFSESIARKQVAEARNVGQWIESRLHLSLTQIADDMFGNGKLTRDERISLSNAVGEGLAAFTTSLEASQPQLYERDLWTDATANVSEAGQMDSDRQELFRNAVRDAYAGDNVDVWVRDFDDTVVYFDRYGGDDPGTFSQTYTEDDDAITLTGTPAEVRAVTNYVPVSPAGSTTTEESEETPMAKIQIEESEHARLLEESGRVTTLTSERDTAIQERDAAVTERDTLRDSANTEAIARVIRESADAAHVTLDEFQVAGLAVKATLGDDGRLNEAALKTVADAAAAKIAEANGVGTVRGFGRSTIVPPPATGEPTVDQVAEARAAAFGRTTVKGA